MNTIKPRANLIKAIFELGQALETTDEKERAEQIRKAEKDVFEAQHTLESLAILTTEDGELFDNVRLDLKKISPDEYEMKFSIKENRK